MADGSVCGDWPVELQEGILTRAQALAGGISDRVIYAHVRRGRWRRLHPGVYATFSGPLSENCALWAAVLRAGGGAVLSYQTAARLWGLAQPRTVGTAIHVTVPSGSPAPRTPGIVLHYSRRVDQARHPVLAPPRTTVEETALDLAGSTNTAEEAVAWILRAVAGRRTTLARIAAALDQRSRMRWRAELAHVLSPVNSGVHSILEFRYVNHVERPHGLPPGTRQRLLRRGARTEYSDVSYDDFAVLVELDGRAFHPDSARYRDTARDNANIAAGWVTLRYTWFDVTQRSCEIAGQLAESLRQRGWTGTLRRCGSGCRVPENLLQPRSRPPSAG